MALEMSYFPNDFDQKQAGARCMGGPGSGRWHRWRSKKTTLDEVHRLDVRWLQRHGYLQRWAQGVLTWHRGEYETGAIGIALEGGRFVVTYRFKANSGAWEPIR